MELRTPLLAFMALVAGIAVGLLAWTLSPSTGEIASIDGETPQLARAVGEPSEPFQQDSPEAPESGESTTGDRDSDSAPPAALALADDDTTTSGAPSLPGDLPSPTSESLADDSSDAEDSSTAVGRDDSDDSSAFGTDRDSTTTGQTSSSSTSSSSSSSTSSASGTTSSTRDDSIADAPVARPSTPSTEAPAVRTPTTQAPAVRTPSTQAPAVRTPTTQAPAVRTPTTQAPAVRTPTTQAPAPRTPTTQAPAAQSLNTSTVYVSTSGNDSNNGSRQAPVASFERAVQLSNPGHSIVFEPGRYAPIRVVGVNGTAANPIRIVGNSNVEFRSTSYSREAGVLVKDSNNVEITGITVRHALWGVYIQNSHGIELHNSDIGDIGQEAVRIKDASSNILVQGNTIADTGRRTDNDHANGEGVYIGTGTPSNVDHVRNVTVRNNTIARLTDEAIDIKIPSTNVLIEGNTISEVHTQTTGAIVVHLNNRSTSNPNIAIQGNTVRNVTRSSPYRDGNCIVTETTVRIANNTLQNCQHRGIFVQGSSGTATILNNSLINTGSLGAIVNDGKGQAISSSNNQIR